MNLAQLTGQLTATGLKGLAFPSYLLGSFRRKSITFSNGLTDETTVVYWFQSRSFSIDLRLSDGAQTPVSIRQGWIGDTLWDDRQELLSWHIVQSYQPHNQWPEPAKLHPVGNSVLEFAPSGAYVEDWRQQSASGPLIGLRLKAVRNERTGTLLPMDGGLIVAGAHAAYAQSRLPDVEQRLRGASGLEAAVTHGLASAAEVESYEVSLALNGNIIRHSTCSARYGQALHLDDFDVLSDGTIMQSRIVAGEPCTFLYTLDVFVPEFAFTCRSVCAPTAEQWLHDERTHLMRNAALVR